MGPNIVFLIPIVSVLTIGGVFLAYSPLGRGLAERLGHSSGPREKELFQVVEDQSARLAAAEDQIESLLERVDFTEKLLQDRPASTSQLSSGGSVDPSQG